MSPEEIQSMAKGLAQGQAVWYLGSAVIGGAITALGAYLAEKGKNRATKEDIGQITQAVEAVKSEFSEKLEDLKAHHQLRMVAAERRLEALQQGYSLWQELFQAAARMRESREMVDEQVERYKVWLYQNTIYLGPTGRKAVLDAIRAGLQHAAFMSNRATAVENADALMENWTNLENVANVFLEEASLPSLSQREFQEMRESHRHI